MVREIYQQVKDEFYHVNQEQVTTERVCIVSTNRQHLRWVVRQKRSGSTGGKLCGSERQGMSFGFIFFKDRGEAWKTWTELLSDKTVLVFVQSEIDMEWAFNHIPSGGESGDSDNKKTGEDKDGA